MTRDSSGSSRPAKPDRLKRTALHYAAAEVKPEDVASLLLGGSDVNAQDKDGWTPLHFAAQSQSKEVVKLLLDAGAKTELQDCHGNTPLHRAVFGYRGNGTVVELLRAAGASATSQNHHGVSSVSLARTIANYDVASYFTDVKAAE